MSCLDYSVLGLCKTAEYAEEEDSSALDWEKLGYDRQYYLRNKARIQAKNRQYRAANQSKIKRRGKVYRRQLKMGRKARKRVGAPGAGYTYISQGGVNFSRGKKF